MPSGEPTLSNTSSCSSRAWPDDFGPYQTRPGSLGQPNRVLPTSALSAATPVAHAAGARAMAARGPLATASPPASSARGSLLRCGPHRPHTTPAPPRS
jgi:hypothetical protein